MLYKLVYLPVDREPQDLDTIMLSNGEMFPFKSSEALGWLRSSIKVVEPFLVSYLWNEMKVIGRPSPEVLKWLKAGMEVKKVDCEELWLIWPDGIPRQMMDDAASESSKNIFIRVKCPTCGVMH